MAYSPSIKSIVASSAMKNPKLRQLLTDAFNSPPGSSKRQYARSVLGLVSKAATRRFSGQGGAPSMPQSGSPWSKYNMPQVQPYQPPLARIPKTMSGQGGGLESGLGSAISTFGSDVLWPGMKTIGEAVGNVAAAPFKAAYGYATKSLLPAVEQVGNVASDAWKGTDYTGTSMVAPRISNAAKTTTPTTSTKEIVKSGTKLYKFDGTNYTYISDPNELKNLVAQGYKDTRRETVIPATMKTSEFSNLKNILSRGEATGALKPVRSSSLGATDVAKTAGATEVTEANAGVEDASVYGPPAPDLSQTTSLSGLPAIQQRMAENMGKNLGMEATFADILNDPEFKDYIRATNPGVPDELLWKGGNISQQLVDYKKKKMEEMGLNDMLEERKKLRAQGANIDVTMSNYVRGRDEYFSHIDQMLTEANTKWASSPLFGDPVEQKRHEQYITYLTNLKGRQYQRYADALDDSTKHFQSNLDRIDADYTTLVEKFNDEFAGDQAVTEESYKNTYAQLTSMYTAISEAANAADTAGTDTEETLKNNARIIAWASGTKDPTVAGEGDLQKGITYVKKNVDATGEINKATNLSQDLLAAFSNNWDINAGVGTVQGNLGAITESLGRVKNKDSVVESDLARIMDVNDILSTFMQFPAKAAEMGISSAPYEEIFKQSLPAIAASEQDLLKKYLLGSKDKLKQFVDGVSQGKKTGGFLGFGAKMSAYTADEAKQFGLTLGINSKVLDMILAVANGDPGSLAGWYDGKDPKNVSADDLADKVAYAIAQGEINRRFPGYLSTGS